MASEIAKRDEDKNPVALAVTNDSNLFIKMLRVDPSTGRLLVDVGTISVSASSASDGATGSAVPTDAGYIGVNNAGNLVGLLAGQQTMADSLAVVIASDQSAIPISGSITATNPSVSATAAAVPADATYLGASSAGTLTGLLLGQQTMANSLAVVLASNQAAIPVSQSGSWVLSAGTAIIGKVTTDQTTHGTTDLVAADITKVGGSALALGQSTMAGSIPVVLPSNQSAIPVSQSGSWVLSAGTAIIGKVTTDQTTHGTTDLVAADITKVGGTALALGQTTMSASVPVVIASNQSAIPASQSGSWVLSAGSAIIGKVGIDQTTIGTTNGVTPVPSSAGGTGWQFKPFDDGTNFSSAAGAKLPIVGAAATFGGYINLYNPNTAVSYIQIFNKLSANVTLGTTTPDFVITLPGLATASGTGTDRNMEMVHGVKLSTGFTIAVTTGPKNSTAPANAVTGTILYN